MSTSSVSPLSSSSLVPSTSSTTSTPSTTTNSNGTYFTGLSGYSSDLNQVITQAVELASLPEENLTTQLTAMQAQSSVLQTLSGDFSGLQSAVSSINSATGLSSYGASVSDNSVATASVSAGVLDGTYSLDVTNLGSVSSAMSNDGLLTVTDPTSTNISASTSYTLTVDSTNYTINLSNGDTLDNLVSAINASGAPVNATIVNVGSTSSPDYRLSLLGQNYADDSIQLSDGSNLMESLATGSPVTYTVNGEPTGGISSDTRSVTLSPGLTAHLIGTGEADITVAQDGTSIANALSSFVSAYNTVVTQLDQSHGQNANALSGQSIVLTLQQDLQQLGDYQGDNPSSTVNTLADLGLDFSDTGQLQFDQSTFDSASSQSLSDVMNFLGSAPGTNGSTTGTGFLGAATNALTSVMDPTVGTLTAAISANSSVITSTESQISTEQTQVEQLQSNLIQQMSTADATIASLQQQETEISNLFQAEALNTLQLTGGA